MGQKSSRTTHSATSKQSPFKLFDYSCPCCKTKRPIQYFYKNGTFLPQEPRVVCGTCNTSVAVEPFKTVQYECPACRKHQKARLPARPVPLNTYNVSVVNCNCGFRGEVNVGRVMDVACTKCWSHKKELRSVWTEDGDELKAFCGVCQDYERSFARAPSKKGAPPEQEPELEYCCENCFRPQPLHAEEILRSQGLAFCKLCDWVGYPEVFPRGQAEAHRAGRKPSSSTEQSTGGKKVSSRSGRSPFRSRKPVTPTLS